MKIRYTYKKRHIDLNEKENKASNEQEQINAEDNGYDLLELHLSQHLYQHLECCLNSQSKSTLKMSSRVAEILILKSRIIECETQGKGDRVG